MRHRRVNRHHDTLERPAIGIWVRQRAIPALSDDGWTFFTSSFDEDGYLVQEPAGLGGNGTFRLIPGVIEGHLYKITVTCIAHGGKDIRILLGGTQVGVLDAVGTFVFSGRPTGGSELNIYTKLDGYGSCTISLLTVDAMDPIELEKIPALKGIP